MKKTAIVLLAIAMGACKNDSKKEEVPNVEKEVATITESNYPEALGAIFDAHGGLDAWRGQHTLVYDIPKKNFTETHTIDLRTRKDRVDSEQFSLGTDGNQVWLLDSDENYKGDAAFYHNLMFYFYAMPFVLADDGIIYSEAPDLEYGGKTYPGIRIAYESGVGTSSKDEYYIHYDAENHQMTWLGYTVTYRTGEKSETIKWIRYDDWQNLEGLTLPKSITWYNFEGAKILDARSTVEFENVTLSKVSKPSDFYEKPSEAVFVEVKKS